MSIQINGMSFFTRILLLIKGQSLLAHGPRTGHASRRSITAVNLRVAIRATIGKQLLRTAAPCQMPSMTLETQERHTRVQKVFIGRSVGRMTVGTVLSGIAMLKNKGPLLLHMAAGAGLFRGVPPEQFFLCRPMDVVTVDAGHLLLDQGVVRK
jgi:hypothetical protein